MIRATFRQNKETKYGIVRKSYLEPEATSLYGLKDENVVGWFANKYNMAGGWVILDTTEEEKREFGAFAFRTYNYHSETTCIIKINPYKGTYAFIDNKAYEEGEIRYEKMEAYNRLIMDNNTIAETGRLL